MPESRSTARRNNLLGSIPIEELSELVDDFELVSFARQDMLFDKDRRPEHAYFPLSGIISTLVVMEDSEAVEFRMVGRDGFASVFSLFGQGLSPVRGIVQLEGEGLRLPASRLGQHVESKPGLRRALQSYAYESFIFTAQSAACNRLHGLEQRCARWLLETHDRADGPQFPMTHQFMAAMLGSRRPSVTLALGALQHEGLIDQLRGAIRVRDRAQLEARSCECYWSVRRFIGER